MPLNREMVRSALIVLKSSFIIRVHPFVTDAGATASYSGRMATAVSCLLEVGAYPWTA